MAESEAQNLDRSGRSGRWRRREQRRVSARNRLEKHGAGLRTVYRDAVLKRLRAGKPK
jgi:hypothetical protein